MNTKIFLLIIALILLLSHTTSTGASIENRVNTGTPAGDHNNHKSSSDWLITWPANDCSGSQNVADHEHESHCFHYDRICKNRKRLLLIICVKLFLLLTHLSTFIFTCIHLLH